MTEDEMANGKRIDPFPPETVRDRIEAMRDATGKTMREVAEACSMSVSQYADKVYREKNRFSVEDINALSRYYQNVTGVRLSCWPFVSVKRAKWIDTLREPLGQAWEDD